MLEFGAYSMQECEDVFRHGDIGAVAGHDQGAVAEDSVSVTDGKTKKTGVKKGLKESGDGELKELTFRIAKDFWRGLGMQSVWIRRNELRETGV